MNYPVTNQVPTTTAQYWPSTTKKYQVPPYTDPVPSSISNIFSKKNTIFISSSKKNLLQILSKHFIQHQMMIFNSSEVWVWWQNSFGMKFNSLLIQLCRFHPSSKGKLRLGVIFLCQAFIIALTKKKTKTTSQPEYMIFDIWFLYSKVKRREMEQSA